MMASRDPDLQAIVDDIANALQAVVLIPTLHRSHVPSSTRS